MIHACERPMDIDPRMYRHDPTLDASWSRSRAHGLDPGQTLPLAPPAGIPLRERLERSAKLITLSRPIIDNLYQAISHPSSTIILSDEHGVILSAIGDVGFIDRAARVALAPGACWSEAVMGMNAIGTALHLARPVTVHHDEHYLWCNRFLTCIASPIRAPTGEIQGALDLSTDSPLNVHHAGALLRTTVLQIENRLSVTLDDAFLTLHFHDRADLLDTPFEAIAVFDENACLIGVNPVAQEILQTAAPSGRPWADFMQLPWCDLMDRARHPKMPLLHLRAVSGRSFIAKTRLQPPAATAGDHCRPIGMPANRASHPGAIDETFLAPLQLALAAGRPVLVCGHTGTGKKHVSRELHHRTIGDAGRCITIDCDEFSTDAQCAEHVLRLRTEPRPFTLVLVDFTRVALSVQRRLLAAFGRYRQVGLIATHTLRLRNGRPAPPPDTSAFLARRGVIVQLPKLSERPDFEALVRLFVHEFSAPGQPLQVSDEAIERLRQHNWPGNLSELRAQLHLIVALMGDGAERLYPQDIPETLFDPPV